MDAAETTATHRPRLTGRRMRLIGYAIAAACLIWVFHGTHPERILSQVKMIRWQWVAGGIGFDILSYLCQGLRWKLLLRSSGSISAIRTTQAIYAGLLTNEMVPLRAGELVRAYLVSRWQNRDLISVVPSMAIERLFDAIWIAIGIGVTALFVHLPKNLLHAADVFGGVVLAATAVFVVLIMRKERAGTHPRPSASRIWKPLRLVGRSIDQVATGIRQIGTTRYFYVSLVTSSLVPLCQIVSFWLVMQAYGLGLSLWIGAAVFLILHFGTALPNAPSNVGTYQFFTVLGLTLFGVDKTTATGFSVAVFVLLTFPLWIIGFAAVASTGMSLGDIRKEMTAALARARPTAPRQPSNA